MRTCLHRRDKFTFTLFTRGGHGGPEGHLEQRSSQVTRSGGVDKKKKETKSDIRREPIVN